MAAVLPLDRRNRRTMWLAFTMAAAMLGLGFAAVPLYDLFCRATGFGGTTQIATEAQADLAQRQALSAGGRQFSIRFDANTASDMATFIARNNSSLPITGTATFNVEPEQAGAYFNKIQCFCFTEQTLQPGQEVRMPVLFYVDPAVQDDPNMEGVEQITLSYTFHRAKQG
jgi:cytochrome c oxidase assembly protein subunit 11